MTGSSTDFRARREVEGSIDRRKLVRAIPEGKNDSLGMGVPVASAESGRIGISSSSGRRFAFAHTRTHRRPVFRAVLRSSQLAAVATARNNAN